MEPLFDQIKFKPPDQVLAEYEAAESVDEWLSQEVADFFSGDDTDTTKRIEQAEAILDSDSDAFDGFLGDQFDEHDLVSLTITITNPRRPHVQVSTFSSLPTPTTLLWLCCQTCTVGDLVGVVHTFANGTEVNISSRWPFGMHEAVAMTTPNPEGLLSESGAFDDDDEEVEEATPARGRNYRALYARLVEGDRSLYRKIMVAAALVVVGVAEAAVLAGIRQRRD